ncbi:BglG family transcription antiterminator [Leptotrichia massiliensis]|uniref:BglG family transcription antiterminator n=1 Tax=Leptotrichia massiliensis TaxID=1852388 RepID=UPI0028D86E5F|nr:PRD domain-containing protein [Leptotrichia massiliensis]
MGVINKNEKKLLSFLSKSQDYITSETLAKMLDISPKTVYRLIKKINDEFSDGTLILSEKGKGYKLDYKKYINQRKEKFDKKYNLSPSERRNRIMEELLFSSPNPKDVDEVYGKYYIGDYAISHDEQLISKEIEKFNLVLQRRKRKIAIIGEEKNVRKAILNMIKMSNVIDIEEIKINNSFDNEDILFIYNQLRTIENLLGIVIPYPYNINIFSHLYILISRSRKVGVLAIFENGSLTDEEKEDFNKDILLKKVSEEIISNIEEYFGERLPERESYYLYQYLVSSRVQGNINKAGNFSAQVMQATQIYLDEMSERMNAAIKSDSIFLDLANHIKPLFNRLEHDIKVQNNLLEQIKIVYGEIFSKVSEVSEIISKKFNLPEINESENGYITLYFARIIETNQLPIKTIIMCTTGVGTSELLKVKIEKNFPELEIMDVTSSNDLKNLETQYPDVELILSTINIEEHVSVNNLVVSALFTINDRERLQRKIEEIYNAREDIL